MLRVLANAPRRLRSGWVHLDSLVDWAVEWSEDEDPGFDQWFMKYNVRDQFMLVFRSMERLVEDGRAEMRRDRRAGIEGELQYRSLNILDALAKAAKRSR